MNVASKDSSQESGPQRSQDIVIPILERSYSSLFPCTTPGYYALANVTIMWWKGALHLSSVDSNVVVRSPDGASSPINR